MANETYNEISATVKAQAAAVLGQDEKSANHPDAKFAKGAIEEILANDNTLRNEERAALTGLTNAQVQHVAGLLEDPALKKAESDFYAIDEAHTNICDRMEAKFTKEGKAPTQTAEGISLDKDGKAEDGKHYVPINDWSTFPSYYEATPSDAKIYQLSKEAYTKVSQNFAEAEEAAKAKGGLSPDFPLDDVRALANHRKSQDPEVTQARLEQEMLRAAEQERQTAKTSFER